MEMIKTPQCTMLVHFHTPMTWPCTQTQISEGKREDFLTTQHTCRPCPTYLSFQNNSRQQLPTVPRFLPVHAPQASRMLRSFAGRAPQLMYTVIQFEDVDDPAATTSGLVAAVVDPSV